MGRGQGRGGNRGPSSFVPQEEKEQTPSTLNGEFGLNAWERFIASRGDEVRRIWFLLIDTEKRASVFWNQPVVERSQDEERSNIRQVL